MSGLLVYLAGPDVFLANAADIANEKRRLCQAWGFVGASPVDNEIDIASLPRREAAFRISQANEEMIRGCQLVIANVTPFRSPSADVGTAYEMGFARALGLPVFAYSNVVGTLRERTVRFDGVGTRVGDSGDITDRYGMAIENFDLSDNLMLVGAVQASGAETVTVSVPDAQRFTDLSGFERCLSLAAKQLGIRRTAAAAPY